jgi:hypothetical protein
MKHLLEIIMEKGHFGDGDSDGRTILNWIFEK